ncbi:MAG: hypothetical protein ACLFUB_17645 [Cyclobacteriaceae bacterium]
MDILKKTLLLAFYLIIIAVGVAGFYLLSSVRERSHQPDKEQLHEDRNISQMEEVQ